MCPGSYVHKLDVIICHAEQVSDNETSGCRGKHMKTTNDSDSNSDGIHNNN